MVLGILMYPISNSIKILIPWVIGAMLFLTYLKVKPRDFDFNRSHLILLGVQLTIMSLSYILLYPFSSDYAQAMSLCFLMPAATAGPAIVRLLSGKASFTATYVLLTHFAIILLAPLLFPLIQPNVNVSFLSLAGSIFSKVAVIVLVPMLMAWLFEKSFKSLSEKLAQNKQIPYLLWLFSVWLLMGKTTVYIMDSPSLGLKAFIIVGILSAVACAVQFYFGKRLAGRLGLEANATCHAMGQKNTSLAIWLSTLYLSPAAALAAAAYILWQNFVITYRLAKANKSNS